MGKAAGRIRLLGHVLAHAAAGVDGQGQVQRQLRLALEDRDLLRPSVLGDGEVVARQPAYDGAVLVGHIDKDVDQLHVHMEGELLCGEVRGKDRSQYQNPRSQKWDLEHP